MLIDISLMKEAMSCPMKGYIQLIKQKGAEVKSLALECGSLCHNCYALTRLFMLYVDLMNKGGENVCQVVDKIEAITGYPFKLNYDCIRYDYAFVIVLDYLDKCNYDSGNDKRRTLKNIKDAIVEFIKVTIEDMKVYEIYNDKFIGVEHKFTYEYKGNTVFGTIDAVYKVRESGMIVVVENKTTSSLTDAYLIQYNNSYQCTNYIKYLNEIGINSKYVIMQVHTVPINTMMIARTTVEVTETQLEDLDNALNNIENICKGKLLNKASCFNFFRICEFFDICCSCKKDREEKINELGANEWIGKNF